MLTHTPPVSSWTARPRALYEVKKFYDREQDTSFKIKTRSEIQKSKSDVFTYSHIIANVYRNTAHCVDNTASGLLS